MIATDLIANKRDGLPNAEQWAAIQTRIDALTPDEIEGISRPLFTYDLSQLHHETPAQRIRRKRGERLARRLKEFAPELGPATLQLLAADLGRLMGALIDAKQGGGAK